MKTYTTVEEYLEIIAGKRDPAGKLQSTGFFMGYAMKPIVSLARYDVSFLDSVTDTTLQGNALTDRQAELAVKLVNKYTRQLSVLGISTATVNPPVYRKPLRQIDRTRSVGLEGNKICMRFPYDNGLIQCFRDLGKEGQGAIKFDRDSKVWRLSLTEYNINWACAIAQAHGFELSTEIQTVMSAIRHCENTEYKIELQQTDSGYCIVNAADSLVEYINQRLGGFSIQNRNTLVDHAPVLGYTVSPAIMQAAEADLGGSIPLLMTAHEYNFNDSTDTTRRIVQYAASVNRWPIYVFNPTPTDALAEWSKHFAPEEILLVNNQHLDAVVVDSAHRVVYTHKPLKNVGRIPLLVSHVGMIVGFEKANMVQAADKIFYTAVKLK
jgi:hypothetical protein